MDYSPVHYGFQVRPLWILGASIMEYKLVKIEYKLIHFDF